MPPIAKLLAGFGVALTLAACDEGTDFERAAVGALTGRGVGEIVDDNCVTGAAVGGAAGALADDI